MEPASRFGSEGDNGFWVLWEDGDLAFCRGWRAGTGGNRSTVLAVRPISERPNPAVLDRLAHEYGLKDELDSAWAARPLEFVRDLGQVMLVLEDPGGEPLDRLLGEPMEVGSFLRCAGHLAAVLGMVHQRGIVHKDVKPQNIIINRATDEIKLTGFGIASRLPRERQALESPEAIAGTLAYMAPEQTGRMNRSLDSRSDLYSLGVTFYQMLTGQLPFTASDPMEWVHCHIARRPIAPAELSGDVPSAVSKIIMKLLAKTAEERYQTAAGLERDLRYCLAEWEAQRRIEDFALGERDTPDRLLIPEKLYGREREVETLLAAFDRIVKSGAPELVLISGYSGIGKSSVVNELHKVLVPSRGLFAAGKFDQYKRDIPYVPLAQAFQSLVRHLLGTSDTELSSWRHSLLEALGPNGQLMVDVVPELELIIGRQPPVPQLEPQQVQARFQLVFRRFIGAFARPEHPLALFLDDLQWLDAATLDLLEDLLSRSGPQHLMLIGAYRDNEVDAAHPLLRKLDAIKTAGGKVVQITLPPLGREHVGQLISDALGCELERAAPLAQLVHEKTGGNPFFAIQFTSALVEERMLTFDHDAARWSWDLNRIHGKGYTDNIVELMVGKLARLPVETQDALQQFACLGNIAEIGILSIVLGESEERVHTLLGEAVRQEFIERRECAYRFIHDRVQESAYSLIPETLRGQAHLRIGRLFVAHTPAERREEVIFEIVNQLNRGAALITSREERKQLVELNLLAGRRAKAATAYASALNYLVAGAALLPEDSWERWHELTFELELHRGECELLARKLTAAEERLNALSIRAATTVERASVACLRVDLYITLGQNSRAIAIGIDYLRHLGIDWSPHPTEEEAHSEYERIWSQLDGRTIEELIDLPLMSDPESLATLDVLTALAPPALSTDTNLFFLTVCNAVNLSIERGHSDGSCPHYTWLGRVIGERFGDYQVAFRFGQLGHELVERRGLKRFQARTYLNFGNLMVWTRPVRAARDLIRRTFDAANNIGDLTYAAHAGYAMTTNLLFAGDPLVEVQREAEHGLAFARKMAYGLFIDVTATQLGLVRTLRGMTPKFGSLDDENFEELRIESHFASNPDLALAECWYWIRALQARFLAGEYSLAVDASLKAQRLLWTSPSLLETAEYHFYSALSHAATCGSIAPDQHARHLEALASHHRRVEVWAADCPENFESRAALIGAESARIKGRDVEAMRLYEQAIRSARENDFVHNEALANELAARFYAGHRLEKIARVYMQDARYCYLRWGAEGKVRQLDELYPHLREAESARSPTDTIRAPFEYLDLGTVINVSQAVSGEVVLENLIDTLMSIAVAQAGAERALLALSRGAAQRIVAEATTSGGTVIVQLRDQALADAVLPESAFHYVVRTRESVILDDAAAGSPFAADPDIRQRQVRSVCCLPLLNQSRLIGVLYLENNLASRVFSPARMAVLRLLASQAAISLENANLYRDLADREAKIRRLVDANIIGIFIWNIDGRVIEANDAFLHMVGYDREDLALGRVHRTDLTPPEWRGGDVLRTAELIATGTVQPFEKEYFRKDGSRVPVLIGVTAFDEKRDQGVGFVLDLTERKRAEVDLRESEQNYRMLFESIDEGFCTIEVLFDRNEKAVDYRFLQISPSFERQMGIKNAVGRRMREIAPQHEEYWFEIYGSIALTGESMRFENEAKELGSWYEVYAFRVEDPKRRRVGILFNDITERKRAEAEASDSERRYREVQAELARANRVATMGQLTALIAHEVKQPITANVTNARAALRWLDRQTPDLEEVRKALARIVNDGKRAADIIDRIRDLVKKAPPQKDPLEINGAIREVIELARGEAVKNRVSLQMQLAEDLPHIQGDRVQLQQVILNLIINAIQAMSENRGPRQLLVSTRKAEAGNVLVAVQDSGPGLVPEALAHIFEEFHTTKPGGVGLGLSICRSIIEAHDGQLWATANEPHGAIFQFTLPVHNHTGSA